MWFGVLGSLEVRDDSGQSLRVGGPMRRALLAALLCRWPRTVPPDLLIEDLWGVLPPRSAAKTLQSHVVRLRDDLGRGAGSVIVTDGMGYRVELPTDGLDVASFERALHHGVDAQRAGDARRAVARLDEALSWWRDEAYLDFGDAAFAAAERMRLAELRALATETRTDAALRLGESATLVSELHARVAREPYRERAWEQLIIALYRSGRQAQALSVYRTAHDRLAADLGVDPGPALRALEGQILRQDPILLVDATAVRVSRVAAAAHEACPYRGLNGYGAQDAPVFVGRERLCAQLVGRLADVGTGVVVVTGASGSGKSSLVRAGLVPSLRSGGLPGSAGWRVQVATVADPVNADLDVLVLDQAEELFTLFSVEDRVHRVARLASFVARGGRLVLVLRGDFYARLAELPWLAECAQRSPLLVGSMHESELARVVTEPARRAGIGVEPEVVDAVLEDAAGQPQPLPLISLALVRAWEHRVGDAITLASYEAGHRVAGAIEATAEAIYQAMDAERRTEARRLLVRLAAREGSTWVRHPLIRPSEPSPEFTAAADALATGRLVTVTPNRIELSHDALLERWPRLRGWLDERAAVVELLEHLVAASGAWSAAGRLGADLYRGPRLQAALDWRSEHPADLSPAEVEFLDASAQAAESDLAAARAQVVREVRGRRRLRLVAVGLAFVLVLAGVAALVAARERTTARQSAARAQQSALAADARRLAALSGNAPDIATSSLLAAAAYRLQDSPDTRGALLDAVERNQSALWRIQLKHRPQRIAATPDSSRLAVNDFENQVTVIDPRTRKQVASFPAAGWVEGITTGGRQVVTYGATNSANPVGRLAAYDVPSGRERVLTDAVDQDLPEPVTTTDGRWVAAITTRHVRAGSVVQLFDSANWNAPPRQFATNDPPSAMAASRSAVAVEHPDGSVEVRALPSLRLLGSLPATKVPATDASQVAVSPDGSQVARVDPAQPAEAVLYRVRGAPTGTPLPVQPLGIAVMAFGPDGSELAVASESGSLNVYRTSDGAAVQSFTGHAGALHGIAWTGTSAPTGLYTIGLDGQLVSWDLSSGPRTISQSGANRIVPNRAERFGPLVIGHTQPPNTSNSHRLLYTIDVRTGAYTNWPAGLRDDEGIGQVVSSLDGRRGLVCITGISGKAAGQNRIEIFDLRTHHHLGHLALPTGTAFFVDGLTAAISPDARLAYSSLGRQRIGVFALPSGRYLRSFIVHYADPDGGRVEVIPWQFDPVGRLILGGYDPGPQGAPWSKSYPALPADQRLGLLDVSSGRLLAQTGLGDVAYPTALAWTPDARSLAIATYDGTLALYDAATFAVRANAGIVAAGPIQTVDFASDGRTLITAGGALNFWQVPNLAPEGRGVLIGSSQSSGSDWAWYARDGDVVGLSQDERQPNDNLVRWFTFHGQPAELATVACQLAGSDITRAQWLRYVGTRPYQHVCPESH